ncbi:uracil/xanthine transporter [Paenibacillus oenotherae]|uniref:Uracil/xanthine transporter n=1 Tax=Paenibacillus oenotherae TaxID=1435645 RepID=A0ABS7D9A7_9BACL|nr:uracil/xanthine transporter [Paenibacillus oenotherae]MBW7476097.1 uracil/xanthine transporter [Paenibacillus oenotherae]
MLKQHPVTLTLAGAQWFFYIFTNTIVVPLSLGHAFHLGPDEIAGVLQRSFILTGALCILQALFGHRYAVMDGLSGVWWSLTLNLCASAEAVGLSLSEVGGGLAAGFILSSVSMMVLGYWGFGHVLQRIFTPTVKGVFLFLLSVQLSLTFFKGMLGLDGNGRIDWPVTLLSIGIACLVALLGLKGRGMLGNYSVLIGIVAGWIAYSSIFPAHASVQEGGGALLSLFPWGAPHVEIGIILTAFFVGIINMTNTITCLSTVEKLYGKETTDGQYKRSFLLTGLFSVGAAVSGLIPFGLFTSSIGFLESTRILRRAAFVIGAAMIVAIGMIPPMMAFFSTLPPSVGYAVLFIAYLQMFGTSLRAFQGMVLNTRTVYRIALPVLLGIGIMNVPPQAFAGLPLYIGPIVSNGLVMGGLMSVLLETLVDWSDREGE